MDKEIREWLLTPKAHQIIDATKRRLMGLESNIKGNSLSKKSVGRAKPLDVVFEPLTAPLAGSFDFNAISPEEF